jgi:hypothetical protein
MAKRGKTLLELEPTYLWDASYGVLDANGAACGNGGYVASWVAKRGTATLVQAGADAKKPRYYHYSMGNRPAVFFVDGTRALWLNSCPMASWTDFTIAVGYEMLAHEPGSNQHIVGMAKAADAANNFALFGCRTTNNPMIITAIAGNAYSAYGGTNINDTNEHVTIWTRNTAGTDWNIHTDATEETLSVQFGGNEGHGLSSVEGMDRLSIGGWTVDGSTISFPFYGKVSYIAMWSKLLT